MFKFISKKNISATAISLSLLLGTFAPVTSAFAKPALGKDYDVKQGADVTVHRRTGLVFDGSPFGGKFRATFRLGNRSISRQ